MAGEHGLLMFTDPAISATHKVYVTSEHRKDKKLPEESLTFYVVHVHKVRLYCVAYPAANTPSVIGVYQNTGSGLSTRASEELLKYVDSDFTLVEASHGEPPTPSYLPECEAHGAVRRRIRDLLHRAPIDPEKVKVAEDDVFLYNTGMAAIHGASKVLTERDSGTVLVLGSIFHNTWHLFEEGPEGMKHFGRCDASSGVMESLEAWLEEHYKAAKTVSYAFVEFPSNPVVVSPDLKRLREIVSIISFPGY